MRAALLDGDWPLAGSWSELSRAMDRAVVELAAPSGGMAVVATGGYGRAQLCAFSDIDLMLVVPHPISEVPPVFRALWDAGLAVGHAVRTPAQAAAAALERVDTLCSMLDMRLVGGDPATYQALRDAVSSTVRLGRLRQALTEEEAQRRVREPYHLQAVNLKTGRGGLRALHGMRWLAKAEGRTDLPDLNRYEAQLLLARQAVHVAAGRRHETLDFSLRPAAARLAGIDVDTFLRETYRAAREVDAAATQLLDAAVAGGRAEGAGGRLFRSARSRLGPRGSVEADPWGAAATAVRRDPKHPQLSSAESAVVRDPSLRIWGEAGREAFVQLAGAGQAGRRVFDQLRAAGFLGRALPEWERIVGHPQLDPFHLHPLDDHLWRAAAEVMRLAGDESDEPWARDIAEELGSLDEVLLAALFHDIGKGTGRDHSEAGADIVAGFGTRAGFDELTVGIVRLLVAEHLLLPQVATRHDLDDPAVIHGVADRVGDPDVLRMLYLLTVADARATGPEVWTAWRASLIRRLFARTMDALQVGGPRRPPIRAARIDEVTRTLAAALPAGQIQTHLASMPETYALRTPAAEVRRHLLLVTPPPVINEVRIDVVDDDEWSDLVIVTLDRPGLLALVSGVLALSNISILEARLTTRSDHVVVDRFHVVDSLRGGPIETDRWEVVAGDLRQGLAGGLDLQGLLAEKHSHYRSLVDSTVEPSVRIIPGADHGTHRIELRGADRVGLLHDVALVLHECDVDVRFAKIDTQGGRVIDTFHVFLPDHTDPDTLIEQARAAAAVPA